MWQVCLEFNVPSLFAVQADPGDPRLRVDSVPQGPKQGSYLRNRPVMRLCRPAMSVARESMVRILVVVKFLACTPGARTNPRHWKAQCQAKEGTPLLHMPLFGLICGTDYTKPSHGLPPQVALLRGITLVRFAKLGPQDRVFVP